MSTQILLKKWARQREVQEQKHEKSRAAKDFFDRNRNLTSHFESWTTPKFYQQSSQQIERTKETRRKEEELEERRQRLREVREREEHEWHMEQKQGSRLRVPTKCLSDINNHLAEERRKTELESQLYSRWRFDSTREKIMHDSRSAHEALAKLSWLDKQVEQNMERERQTQEAAEREKRIQEQTEHQERLLRESRQVLDGKMREARMMQECHLDVMRQQDSESRLLHDEQEELRQLHNKIDQLFQKWQEDVESHTKASPRPMHNLRRIKMLIEGRIIVVRERITADMEFLGNILEITNDATLEPLMGKFHKHLDDTATDTDRIRSLYDSEAKSFLAEREVVWGAMTETRERLIRHTVKEILNRTKMAIEKNTMRHNELSEMKASNLRAIDHTNELLSELKMEQNTKTVPHIEIQNNDSISVDDISQAKKQDDEESIVNQLSSQRNTPSDSLPSKTRNSSI